MLDLSLLHLPNIVDFLPKEGLAEAGNCLVKLF